MGKTAGRILKSEDVKLEGRFLLDVAQTGLNLPKQGSAASAPPQVRIMESHVEYAVIEVICSCGTKMSLRCEYAGAQPPDDPPT